MVVLHPARHEDGEKVQNRGSVLFVLAHADCGSKFVVGLVHYCSLAKTACVCVVKVLSYPVQTLLLAVCYMEIETHGDVAGWIMYELGV